MVTTAEKKAAAAAAEVEAETEARINERQMRQMHALLHEHGWSDRADILDMLSVMLDREVTSRKDLTVHEAAEVIAKLDAAPRTLTPALMERLRAPFPPEQVGKLPRSWCKDCADNRGTCTRHTEKYKCTVCNNYHSDGSLHLDFVGHADVTARLLSVDPAYTWRPWTTEELNALPPAFRDGLWIWLTVAGVTRPGFGDADGKKGGNAVKEAIGDALRNSSMRFGVALELWAMGDRDWVNEAEHSGTGEGAAAEAPPEGYVGPATPALLAKIDAMAAGQGTDREGMTRKWRSQRGDLPVEALETLPPETLAPLVQSIEHYIAQQQANPAG